MKSFFCVLGMLVTLLLGMAMLALAYIGVTKTYSVKHHGEWQTTEAQVTFLVLEQGITGYTAEVKWLYMIEGKPYSDTLTERMKGAASSGEHAAKREIVQKLGLGKVQWRDDQAGKRHQAELRAGKNMTAFVFYHPKFPSNTFFRGVIGDNFENESSTHLKVTAVCSVLFALFCFGFYSCLRALLRREVKTSDENLFADVTPS